MSLDLGRWLPEFPVREQWLYLDHAAVCPLPRPVAEAMRERIRGQETSGYAESQDWHQHALSCRHLGAQLIGCAAEDISLVRSTSEGLSLIAHGLEWNEGDQVLVGEQEFAANVAPWLSLERFGVEVVRFPQTEGRVELHEVESRLGAEVRLLAVSWVSFHTGWVAPLARLARICRDHDTVVVVDAIQGLGALHMNMRALGVDAVVADGHKWMLGPEGVGLMATTPTLRARLKPVLSGWRSVERARGSLFLDRFEPFSDGRRFEPGATNEVGIAGLAAALDLLMTIGSEAVEARLEMLSRLLTRILIAHGWEVQSPGSGHPVAGIVAARHPTVPHREVVTRLRERHVMCSARQGLVRFSPHFYVTRGELEAFDRILTKLEL